MTYSTALYVSSYFNPYVWRSAITHLYQYITLSTLIRSFYSIVILLLVVQALTLNILFNNQKNELFGRTDASEANKRAFTGDKPPSEAPEMDILYIPLQNTPLLPYSS